jgi:hypothetical protein
MSTYTLEVEWEKMRPGVTVVQADGDYGRAAVVDRSPNGVVVIFTDGRREQHRLSERVQVLVHEG